MHAIQPAYVKNGFTRFSIGEFQKQTFHYFGSIFKPATASEIVYSFFFFILLQFLCDLIP